MNTQASYNSGANSSSQAVSSVPPWQDREVGAGTKLFVFLMMIILVFVFLGLFTVPVSKMPEGTLQTIAGLVTFGISCLILFLLWKRFLWPPSKFDPGEPDFPQDKVGELFDVKFNSNFSRTFTGKGTFRFKEKGIEVNGILPPSLGFQLSIIALVTFVPLVIFKIGLGIIPALLIASYFGKQETFAWMPYERLSLNVKGRTASLKHSESTPGQIKLRLSTHDGERFYRELQSHYAQAIAHYAWKFTEATPTQQSTISAVVSPSSAQPVTQATPPTVVSSTRVYMEKDNLGTRQDTLDKAQGYWVSRMVAPIKDPFVLYTFDSAAAAKAALLELPCIKVSVDTGALICTDVLTFGYYPDDRGNYEAILCGGDLTLELWEQAQAAFLRHSGRQKNDLKPEPTTVTPLSTQTVSIGDVVFDTEAVKQNGGTTFTYRYYTGPNAASAKAFLEKTPVTQRCFYVIVETPEGTYGRDIDGIYKQ